MEHVVYILGAGFSAPLGIPVMSNFIEKSKDLYFSEPEKFSHFQSIYDSIQKMSFIKNYYNTDLFNIEEILSLIEMENVTNQDLKKESFTQFLTDVIENYTPKITPYNNGNLPGNWNDWLFGQGDYSSYGYFVSELLRILYKKQNDTQINSSFSNSETKYSIITLNYDLVIENGINYIEKHYKSATHKIEVIKGIKLEEEILNEPFYISKLHGCIENGSIVPPTWRKDTNEATQNSWILAKKLLESANHIRILGYSLPITDSYLKYLFKSSIVNTKHLKSLDIINLDNTLEQETEKRYKDFISFNKLRYVNRNLKMYLNEIATHSKKGMKDNKINSIEEVHNTFMLMNM